jgi:hypothetical protein
MIGVIVDSRDAAAAEELFELFKTPWERYVPGRSYDAVILAGGSVTDVTARLLVEYGSEFTSSDQGAGLVPKRRRRGGQLDCLGAHVPLYGEALTFEPGNARTVCRTTDLEIAGAEFDRGGMRVVRLGYDLFREVAFLLSVGQPVENARVPTLDIHIQMLRNLLLDAGIALLEIPPTPAGHPFMVCLTHDIDFVGIRRHRLDHTMWGFLYRSTWGAWRDFLRGRISFRRLLRAWQAAALLPFVYLGWAKDYWDQLDWYLGAEHDLPATYYLIPFKNRPGEGLKVQHPARRAAKYDIADIPEWTASLQRAGCEIGVHGIDAWHSVEKGREERGRIAMVTGEQRPGIRMHWLARDENTFRVLEESGYAYDSTAGYNEAVGYRCGTTQVFRPLTARCLLEVPLHIQDGALFYRQRLDLSEQEAWAACEACISDVRRNGGVLTVLWHDRSPGPERFWGGFYLRLVERLRTLGAWFGTAGQAADWFRKRRSVRFEQVEKEDGSVGTVLVCSGGRIEPPLILRVHRPGGWDKERESHKATGPGRADYAWNGETAVEADQIFEGTLGGRRPQSHCAAAKPEPAW